MPDCTKPLLKYLLLLVFAQWNSHLVFSQLHTVSVRILSESDDSEERLSDGEIDLTSSDIELISEGGVSKDQIVGLRFVELELPQGAIIESSHVQFTVDETDNEPTSVEIYGHKTINSGEFTGVSYDISSREKTSNSVSWSDIPFWTNMGNAGPNQQTPDLTSIIQELVNQANWSTSSPVTLLIIGSGQRTAESFEGESTGAALLEVSYRLLSDPMTI